jgi:hypothetical protein
MTSYLNPRKSCDKGDLSESRFSGLTASYATPPIDIRRESPLSSLAGFYETDQGLDEEESEVELMIQLSGMVYNDGGSAE